MKRWLALLMAALLALGSVGAFAEAWTDAPMLVEDAVAAQADEAVPESGEVDLPMEPAPEALPGAEGDVLSEGLKTPPDADELPAEDGQVLAPEASAAPETDAPPEAGEVPATDVIASGFATGAVVLGVKEKIALSLEGGVDPASVGAAFTSSKPKVASVNATTGVVTGKKAGTAVITVDIQGVKSSCTVTVRKAPRKVTLSAKKKTLGVGEAFGLKATLPKKTASALTWTSSNPGVAVVDGSGVVTAVSPGTATITVKTFNKKKASCKLTIKKAPEYVALDAASRVLWTGRSVKLSPILSPGSGGGISYATSDPAVAVMDGSTLRAVGIGSATITVQTYNGQTATMAVQVTKAPVYRALLVGETFRGTFDALPAKNDVNLLKKTLKSVKGPSGSAWKITTKLDRTASQIHSDIQTAFAGAEQGDISLFFISTHGDMDIMFEYGDGEYAGHLLVERSNTGDALTLPTLAKWLAEVPGQVIVLIDSCGSGAAIYNSKSTGDAVFSPAAFDQAVIEAFKAEDKGVMAPGVDQGAFVLENKFYVITASDYMEFSWATSKQSFFTKWLCDGIKTKGRMPADSNKNKITTLNELYTYTARQASKKTFKSRGVSYKQHVQVYPANSGFEMFYRK
ncbi:MAG: Ig-like domain-containing protein [Clostridia bacterium]|nr:Ig-like domain-containing protein [Clostridia bacterium]